MHYYYVMIRDTAGSTYTFDEREKTKETKKETRNKSKEKKEQGKRKNKNTKKCRALPQRMWQALYA